jgi:hypothetical protein
MAIPLSQLASYLSRLLDDRRGPFLLCVLRAARKRLGWRRADTQRVRRCDTECDRHDDHDAIDPARAHEGERPARPSATLFPDDVAHRALTGPADSGCAVM